ncbi:MAG: PAS domain-containing sensor histidine kinase [Acidobacteria bacterium]|nr:PAS domain-containing sensor histidine kinase [Acidobacteriota bacterium]
MAQSQAVQSARTSPGRILAIGERQDSVSGLWPTLGVEARDIVAVASEDEALRRIQDEDFAAIILIPSARDSNLIELARRIRQCERSRETPVLVAGGAAAGLSPEELREFVRAAAHDLKEPTRTVASYSALLSRRYEDRLDEDGREFLAHVIDASQRLETLINDVATYLQQVGAGPLTLSRVSSSAVLAGVLLSMQAAIEAAQIKVTYDSLPDDIPSDYSQLSVVFRNLLSNALKYRAPQAPRVHVGVCEDAAEWTFSVADNGAGIAAAHRERVFGAFKRLHGRDVPGTGMGLALSRKIVERHGGRMWVESELGQGSTFFFTIPK